MKKKTEKKGIALITGASRGIGAEFAKQVASSGEYSECWLVARNASGFEDDIIEELRKTTPVKIFCFDLRFPKSWSQLKDELDRSDLELDLLVNNAGFGDFGSFEESKLEKALGLIDLNVRAVVGLTRVFLPTMPSGSGIIMLGSIAAFVPIVKMNLYAASKAFLLSFSRSLREELKPRGIRVQYLAPGPVATRFSQVARDDGEYRTLSKRISPELMVKRSLKDFIKGKFLSIYKLSWKLVPLLSWLLPHSWIAALTAWGQRDK